MPKFGKTSKKRLATCHEQLQEICELAIKQFDFAVLCGHRTREDQNKLYPKFSKVKWPHSMHNKKPSLAVDLAPWPIDWSDIGRFSFLALVIHAAAKTLGYRIEWGGDWKTFKDYPHFQLKLGGNSKKSKKV